MDIKLASDGETAMTTEKAYEMGYRHIADLAEMSRIADLINDERFSDLALRLMEAWRAGAMAARDMIERETSTLQ